jgi:hypothetical protein
MAICVTLSSPASPPADQSARTASSHSGRLPLPSRSIASSIHCVENNQSRVCAALLFIDCLTWAPSRLAVRSLVAPAFPFTAQARLAHRPALTDPSKTYQLPLSLHTEPDPASLRTNTPPLPRAAPPAISPPLHHTLAVPGSVEILSSTLPGLFRHRPKQSKSSWLRSR